MCAGIAAGQALEGLCAAALGWSGALWLEPV